MEIVVTPHNEQEEKILLAFLNSMQYEYTSLDSKNQMPVNERKQTIEEYNDEIAEAEKEYKKGKSVTTDELKKSMNSW
jgi:hypothetical protein